jgi:hypothetical protein
MTEEPKRIGPPMGNRNAAKNYHPHKVTADVSPETWDWIKAQREAGELSQGKAIDKLYQFWKEHHGNDSSPS